MFNNIIKQFTTGNILHYHENIGWSTNDLVSKEIDVLVKL